MTPVEIAYFKHFMFDKDLARSFQHLYRTRRILGSPRGDKDANQESIEDYFLKTSAKDVIMKAFYFAPTNNNAQRLYNTYDYWKDIDDKWQEYIRQNESNFSNDSWPQLRKTFAILRQNWDVSGYWKKENLESTEEVYERMHIDLPLPDFIWLHGDVPPMAKEQTKEEVPLVDFTDDEEDDPLAEFDFLDDVLPSNYRLKSGEISINFNKGNKITFNQIDSKVIRESGLKYARLAKNKVGEICLILNNQKGSNVTNARSGRGNINVTINSSDICGKIKMFFSLKNTYSILQVEKLQATQEFFIYKISKQK